MLELLLGLMAVNGANAWTAENFYEMGSKTNIKTVSTVLNELFSLYCLHTFTAESPVKKEI